MERYGGSYVLCPRRVSLIYPPRPYLLYLNPSPYPPLDYSYSLQIRFVLLLLLRRPVRRHYKTCGDLLLRQRNAAQQIRRVQRPIAKTLRGMRPISTNNDSLRHEQ
ncbi:hypothetical protein HBI74_215970 [Parastagonospora nodorum]|nr:hypothetical protein HBI74_215970 [Parastagonospora nodorum]